MSEFAAGYILLKKDVENIKSIPSSIIKDLNDKYSVLVMQGSDKINSASPDCIYELSTKCPILYFFNYEDYGWGYRLIHQGNETARVLVEHDIDYRLFVQIANERYPDEDPNFGLSNEVVQGIYNEIHKSEEYSKLVEQQFQFANVEQFSVFDLDIDKLKKIFSPERVHAQNSLHSLVEEFKGIVGIKEMEWISYRYLEQESSAN